MGVAQSLDLDVEDVVGGKGEGEGDAHEAAEERTVRGEDEVKVSGGEKYVQWTSPGEGNFLEADDGARGYGLFEFG